jgi:hypothetical protein
VKPAAGDLIWHDTYETLLGTGVPWKQWKTHGVHQVVPSYLLCPPLNNDAPRFANIGLVAIGLESDGRTGD